MFCEDCSFYDLKKEYCRMNSTKRPRSYSCKAHKKREQEGQYKPNAWDEWKVKAERKVRSEKVKSA